VVSFFFRPGYCVHDQDLDKVLQKMMDWFRLFGKIAVFFHNSYNFISSCEEHSGVDFLKRLRTSFIQLKPFSWYDGYPHDSVITMSIRTYHDVPVRLFPGCQGVLTVGPFITLSRINDKSDDVIERASIVAWPIKYAGNGQGWAVPIRDICCPIIRKKIVDEVSLRLL